MKLWITLANEAGNVNPGCIFSLREAFLCPDARRISRFHYRAFCDMIL
jgi:hypothetical protein